MLKKCKNILIALTGITMLLTPALVPALASADTSVTAGPACAGAGLDISGTSASCNSSDATNTFHDILVKIINIFSAVVGVIAVIMIIVGGLKYITSGGDSGNITGAKNTIIFALVGLVVVALAQVIVHFVLSNIGQ